jgi:hypothetical protein
VYIRVRRILVERYLIPYVYLLHSLSVIFDVTKLALESTKKMVLSGTRFRHAVSQIGYVYSHS